MIWPETRTPGASCSLLAGLLSIILAGPAAAQAGVPGSDTKSQVPTGLTVSPLRIELAAQDRAQTINVNNGTDRLMAIQGRVFSWTQVDGKDVYVPSADLTVTPSIISIPPGQTQLVRVLRKNPASPNEKTYRLVIDQLPESAQPLATGTLARIRFVLPLFVDRDKAKPSKLIWRLNPAGLNLSNEGGATARLVNIAMKRANGEAIALEDANLRYVLGGASFTLPLSNGCMLGPVRVTAMIDGEAVDVAPDSACG